MRSLMEVTAKPLSVVLALSTLLLGVSTSTASASMVPTTHILHARDAQRDRQKVLAFLSRSEVQQQMERMGVNAQQAQARVAAMSDAQVHALAGRINQMPAGGDAGILGIAFAVFVVLLVTDILGFTDVFPFVKKHVHLKHVGS